MFELDKIISEIIDVEFSSDSDDENPKSSKTKSANTKAIEGGLSMETFTTLSHTLRATVDCVKYLLDEKRILMRFTRKNQQ